MKILPIYFQCKVNQPNHLGARALICVMQYMENLSDRQAADAVRGRIDWKGRTFSAFRRLGF